MLFLKKDIYTKQFIIFNIVEYSNLLASKLNVIHDWIIGVA